MYIAAYDTEAPDCLAGVREIVKRHEAHSMPGTFFLVANLLDRQRDEYVALLRDHPLFEIACHSYSHMVIHDTPEFGKAGPLKQFPRELVESKARLEDVFGQAVTGFRPPVSTDNGLRTAPEALRLLAGAGYGYVSSLAWGPSWSLPALLVKPFTYAAEGYPDLWELPPCGWHENLLKGNNRCGPVRVGLFPPAMPEAIPTDYVKTPEEEFRYNNRPFIDKAVREDFPLVSLIWHPWSLHRFDAAMKMLDLTFSYVQEHGLATGTFSDALTQLRAATA